MSEITENTNITSEENNEQDIKENNEQDIKENNKQDIKKQRKRQQIINLIIKKILPIVLIFVITGAFVFVMILFKNYSTRKAIIGTWDYDGYTVYSFDKGGKGALELPNNTYAFNYEIEGEKLEIDYEDETAIDSTYTYSISGDMLTIVNEEGMTFEMQKIQQ